MLSSEVPEIIVAPSLAENFQGAEDLVDGFGGFALELAGQYVGGLGADGQEAAHGFDLVGHGFGPGGLFRGFGGCRGGGIGAALKGRGGLGGFGGLVLGP